MFLSWSTGLGKGFSHRVSTWTISLHLEIECSISILCSFCQCAYVFDALELLRELSLCRNLSRLHRLVISLLTYYVSFSNRSLSDWKSQKKQPKGGFFQASVILADRQLRVSVDYQSSLWVQLGGLVSPKLRKQPCAMHREHQWPLQSKRPLNFISTSISKVNL